MDVRIVSTVVFIFFSLLRSSSEFLQRPGRRSVDRLRDIHLKFACLKHLLKVKSWQDTEETYANEIYEGVDILQKYRSSSKVIFPISKMNDEIKLKKEKHKDEDNISKILQRMKNGRK